jgi:pre-rRNA-processing protein TSR1
LIDSDFLCRLFDFHTRTEVDTLESLPFRFKGSGGANMAPISTGQHHHRSTTKVSHKSFKAGHASKRALKDKAKGAMKTAKILIFSRQGQKLTLFAGKVERAERGTRKTPHQQLMSKLDRRNQARQKQQNKQQERAQATSIFSGSNGAPRHVAIVPLSVDIDTTAIVRALNESVDASSDGALDMISRVRVDRFRQNLQYIPAKYDLMSALDACRMADFVIVAVSAEVEVEEQGELLLRSIEGQGISNVIGMVQVCLQYEPVAAGSWLISHLLGPRYG